MLQFNGMRALDKSECSMEKDTSGGEWKKGFRGRLNVDSVILNEQHRMQWSFVAKAAYFTTFLTQIRGKKQEYNLRMSFMQ